jgi:hypothetical protein
MEGNLCFLCFLLFTFHFRVVRGSPDPAPLRPKVSRQVPSSLNRLLPNYAETNHSRVNWFEWR